MAASAPASLPSGSLVAAHDAARSSRARPHGSCDGAVVDRLLPGRPGPGLRREAHGERSSQPREPRRPGAFGLLDRPVHGPRVPRLAAQPRGNGRPEPGGGAGDHPGLAGIGGRAQQPLGRAHLAGREQEQPARDRRSRIVEPRRVAGTEHGFADEAGPQGTDRVRRGHGHRVEPGGDPLPLPARRVGGTRRPERGLGADVPVDGRRPAAIVAGPARGGQRDPGVVALDRGRHGVDPGRLLRGGQALALAAEQPPHGVPVLRAAVGAQRLGQGPVGFEHLARPRVPYPGLGLAERLDQHPVEVLAQDLVVAEGLVVVLHRDGEHAAARQLVEEDAAARGPPQAIAQRPRQPPQDAGVEQERAQVLAQPDEHVLGEVLAQEAPAHLGAAQQPPALVGGAAPRREVEQLEPRGPALRPARQHGEVARQHGVVVDVAEQLLDLPGPEPQVVRPELQELARDAQPGEVDRRRHAAGDDHGEPRRRVIDQATERGLRGRALEGVPVVDHQRGRRRRVRLEGLGDVLDAGPAARQVRERGPQRRLEMADERALVRVPGLRAVPADRDGGRGREPGDQRRLAGPRRRDDQRQPMAPGVRKPGLEALTGQGVRGRHPDLRGYHEGHGHTRRPPPFPSRTLPVSQSPPSSLATPVGGACLWCTRGVPRSTGDPVPGGI